jgi:proteic killer suppression protein
VIASFRDEWLWAFFVDDAVAAHPLRYRKPALPQAADDRRRDNGSGSAVAAEFRGELAGLHSIRVNDRWRLIFHWDGGRGEAESVYLDDHSYR